MPTLRVTSWPGETSHRGRGDWWSVLRIVLGRVASCFVFVVLGSAARAWEGHEWERWRRVATWEKPGLATDQTGQTNLAPLLGDREGSVRAADWAEWTRRADAYRGAIQAILGKPTELGRLPVEYVESGRVQLEGYSRRHLRIRTEVDDWIPAFLLVPDRMPSGKAPAMLCLHQTVAQGKEEPCGIRGNAELAFAVELVRRGFVCLAPDVIGFGERIPTGKQPYQDSLDFYRRHPNWSFMGKMIWDVGRMVDFLETLPGVDPTRIGSIGHSHGAYGTLFAAAFEQRIAAAVASCGFTTFRSDPHPNRWSHLTALIPQLGEYLPDVASIPFDWQHVLALAAPRPMYVWYATRDTIFPRTENLEGLLRDVRTVYGLRGAENALAWKGFDGPHVFPAAAREQAYRWLETTLAARDGAGVVVNAARTANTTNTADTTNSASTGPKTLTVRKTASAFFPAALVASARDNARAHAWATAIRDPLVAAARPWLERTDEELWGLMFGNTLKRAWQVWSDGHCPSCTKPVPMYEWIADALNHPWKMRCPQCGELFPKNDFAAYYRSGLDAQGLFDAKRADRSLLFNMAHPDAGDPLHRFGVDDGDGYAEGMKRWRFVNAYLIFGQWKQAIVEGIRRLAAAYVATGDPTYAHKAGVLLDRVADFYPTFDFGKEGVMYEGAPRSGYVSTWHDACVEVLDLALAYDAVFEAIARDTALVEFLGAQAKRHAWPAAKGSFGDIQSNIEDRIFRDTLGNRPKIESNYPSTDVTIVTLHTVLGWPGNREEVGGLLDAIVSKATAVDGLTGEKGLAGYSLIAPHAIAALLGRYARVDPEFLPAMIRRHPKLRDMYRFHVDTWCLGRFYPRTGDTGSFAEKSEGYAGLPFTRNPGVDPSSYGFLWALYRATGDADFVRILHGANGRSTEGLPFDLFEPDPLRFQERVRKVIETEGSDLPQRSVNKEAWGLAVLRSGVGPAARAAWLDYDSGERHGHADGMTIGLFAKGLDLLPDFGYPPVQFGGWLAPRAVWYTRTAAHNTVAVDDGNHKPGTGKTTLWFDGAAFRTVRANAPSLVAGKRFERTLALIDTSPDNSYLVDVFRVEGGRLHTRFLHGHFGQLSTEGLRLRDVADDRYGTVMRGFRRDVAPDPIWSADWAVRDELKHRTESASGAIHLRYTDLTEGRTVDTAESWIAVGMFGGVADAWIPSVLTRRRSDTAPLVSTFVGVIEPYEGRRDVDSVRRTGVVRTQGAPTQDGDVALEIRRADGGRDWVVVADAQATATRSDASMGPLPRLEVPEAGLRMEGELAWVRTSVTGESTRVVVCRARALDIGRVSIRSSEPGSSSEVELSRGGGRVVAGAVDSVVVTVR